MGGWTDGRPPGPEGAPSSVAGLARLARGLEMQADAVDSAVAALVSAAGDLAWSSLAADVMRARLDVCAGELRGSADSLREAADGVHRHIAAYRVAEADMLASTALPVMPLVTLL